MHLPKLIAFFLSFVRLQKMNISTSVAYLNSICIWSTQEILPDRWQWDILQDKHSQENSGQWVKA